MLGIIFEDCVIVTCLRFATVKGVASNGDIPGHHSATGHSHKTQEVGLHTVQLLPIVITGKWV